MTRYTLSPTNGRLQGRITVRVHPQAPHHAPSMSGSTTCADAAQGCSAAAAPC